MEPLEQEPSLAAALDAFWRRCLVFFNTRIRAEHCSFTVHTPTFIIQYRSCHVTSLVSVWFVVSVPPHHVLLSVVWFVAEGALNEGSP